jgi:hypothetical protein
MTLGNKFWKSLPVLLGLGFILSGCGKGSQKRVYFGNLEDGSNVESPFKVQMKAENLIVEPATMGVNEGHGHFHIIVDAPLASPSEPMNKDEKHIHYGGGQTEAELNLPVGQHTLILQFAKGDHVPYDPPVYQQVQINVTKENAPAAPAAPAAAPADSAKADTTKKADTTAAKAAPAAPAAPAKKTKKAAAKKKS